MEGRRKGVEGRRERKERGREGRRKRGGKREREEGRKGDIYVKEGRRTELDSKKFI